MARRVMRTGEIPCRIKFCTCLADVESTVCCVHRIAETIHPEPLDTDESFVFLTPNPVQIERGFTAEVVRGGSVVESGAHPSDCACDGSGKCCDCDGEGKHECERSNCYHTHACGTCDGTGECQEDVDDAFNSSLASTAYLQSLDDMERLTARRYLRFALLPTIREDGQPWTQSMRVVEVR